MAHEAPVDLARQNREEPFVRAPDVGEHVRRCPAFVVLKSGLQADESSQLIHLMMSDGWHRQEDRVGPVFRKLPQRVKIRRHCGYEDAVFKRTMTFLQRRCVNDFANTRVSIFKIYTIYKLTTFNTVKNRQELDAKPICRVQLWGRENFAAYTTDSLMFLKLTKLL
ncbi:hypothetical protein JEQ12_002387 [Ovis aries]|uniref:Uncharacterized protein n=1 Tax=Ovis aries TaxID=9940 RepID=A0A836A075_SHEEP|nr:hypothetical protein JEQ12_002387 [Ovis aries]